MIGDKTYSENLGCEVVEVAEGVDHCCCGCVFYADGYGCHHDNVAIKKQIGCLVRGSIFVSAD